MKKIYIALFALLAVGSTFTACTEEEPFATVTENDDPHILASESRSWYCRTCRAEPNSAHLTLLL